jgi:hypothetical protein
MLFNGEIPDGLQVCHRCDVRCCVTTVSRIRRNLVRQHLGGAT